MTSETGSVTKAARIIAGSGIRPFEIEPHNCFACGALNRHGLGLEIHVEPGRAWTEVILEPRFEGWGGIAHGGILCTVLDEVMAWALVGADNWGLTARMSVAFRSPVKIGAPFRADGWVARSRRRVVETEARLVDASGAVLATAEGTYVAADRARRRELQERYGFRLLETAAVGADAG